MCVSIGVNSDSGLALLPDAPLEFVPERRGAVGRARVAQVGDAAVDAEPARRAVAKRKACGV